MRYFPFFPLDRIDGIGERISRLHRKDGRTPPALASLALDRSFPCLFSPRLVSSDNAAPFFFSFRIERRTRRRPPCRLFRRQAPVRDFFFLPRFRQAYCRHLFFPSACIFLDPPQRPIDFSSSLFLLPVICPRSAILSLSSLCVEVSTQTGSIPLYSCV